MRAILLGTMLATMAAGAQAAEPAETTSPWSAGLTWTGEVAGPVSGGLTDRASALEHWVMDVAFDLGAIGWRGGGVHLQIQATSGRSPNEDTGFQEGLSNIEAPRARTRIFELYLQQALGQSLTARAGFMDLNGQFYVTDASGLLTAPPFGLGTELAATGSNGPSTFPATAPAVTLQYAQRESGVFVSLGAFAAEAGNWGDPGGPLDDLDEGGLLIAEAGRAGAAGRFGLGAWTYTEEQPDLRPAGGQARAWGGYLLAERPVGALAGAETTLFLRAGVSDGRTGDFAGSWTAGAMMSAILPERPGSAASLGLRQAFLSDPARDAARAAGAPLDASEFGVEAVLADALTDWLTLKGSVQYVQNPGADPSRDPAVVLGLRLEAALQKQ
jgi:porin